MVNIPGYSIDKEIFRSSNSIIYRGIRENDKKAIVIKLFNRENPSNEEVAGISREFEIARSLGVAGCLKYLDMVPYEKSYALITEDFGGISLSEHIKKKKIELLEGLVISIKLCDVLGKIHQNGIIHKDIKPHNFIINAQSGEIKITDFKISSTIGEEKQDFVDPDKLEGTLFYMSPEQTGRINRKIGMRSDLYSLGITLYELFTGVLPFESTDPIEIIHYHIAVLPQPPHERNPEIPETLSNVILRLLNKDSDKRYRSAFGLKHDLSECLIQLENAKTILPFELGKKDIPPILQFSEKLYSREQNLQELMKVFDDFSFGYSKLVLVSGAPGIGKSALLQQIHQFAQDRGTLFGSGKFEQFKRDEPYSALKNAFGSVIKKILTEKPEDISFWKENFQNALGANASVIIEFIPELEMLMGKHSSVEPLPPTESQNRFNFVFSGFVNVLANRDHPLVLSLDDLQWADSVTIKLIYNLMSDPTLSYLFIFGTYRADEVGKVHPLALILHELQKSDNKPSIIQLAPLETEGVVDLISDTFCCSKNQAEPLAKIIMLKTHGNPFFVQQFIKSLYKDGMIFFKPEIPGWMWNIEQIQGANVTSNVVDLMCSKIQSLCPDDRDAVTTASCIGNTFDLRLLAKVCGRSITGIINNLKEPIKEGLIRPLDFAYKYFYEGASDKADSIAKSSIQFDFLHDRIQQASYSLVPDDLKDMLHLKAGRILLKSLSVKKIEENLFTIVDHFNPRYRLIGNPGECLELAKWNLKASHKATFSMAYDRSRDCAKSGILFLGDNGWEKEYELCRELYMSLAEAEYLLANLEQAEQLLKLIFLKVKTNEEKARVFERKTVIYRHLDKMTAACEAGLEGLMLLGIRIPKNPGAISVIREFLKSSLLLRGRKPSDLLDFPKAENEKWPIAMKLIVNTVTAVFFLSKKNLFNLLCLKGFSLSLEHGLTDISPFMVSSYGIALADVLRNYKKGYDFGKLAISLNERLPNAYIKGQVHSILGFFFSHYIEPLQTGVEILQKSFDYNIEVGNFTYAGYCMDTVQLYRINQGFNIDEQLSDLDRFLGFFNKAGEKFSIDTQQLERQFISGLKGLNKDVFSLSAENFDEIQKLKEYQSRNNGNLLCHFHLFKGILYFFQGHFIESVKFLENAKKYLHAVTCLPSTEEHAFYYSLALIALYPKIGPMKRMQSRFQIHKFQKRMKKWMQNCPENFRAKYLLIIAERARVAGKWELALKLYEEAVIDAREQGFIQVEALANERAGLIFFEKKFDRMARTYIKEALYCYNRWGALAVVNKINGNYPELSYVTYPANEMKAEKFSALKFQSSHSSSSGSSHQLDLLSVIKASQEISSNMVLKDLLINLMEIVIKNAGAQRGFLLSEEKGRLVVKAQREASGNTVHIGKEIFLNDRKDISITIVKYVARTRETIVIDDAEKSMFGNDPYLIQNKVRSILCIPIIRQRHLAGMLYLENNITKGAFTQDRVELLSILSSQIAISMENTVLYMNLEQKVSERTQELKKALGEITALSNTDSLTGIANRRYFFNQFEKEFKRICRYNRTLSLLSLDIDHFKKINDTHGHQAGDLILKEVASILKRELRSTDIIGRIGGEEFSILLPETPYPQAKSVAKRLCKAFFENKFSIKGSAGFLSVTVSIGGYCLDAPPYPSMDTIYSMADQALYDAKKNGRNQVRFAR